MRFRIVWLSLILGLATALSFPSLDVLAAPGKKSVSKKSSVKKSPKKKSGSKKTAVKKASPRKKAPQGKGKKKKRTAKKRAPAPPPINCTSLAVQDDPKLTLNVAWKKQMQHFLQRENPHYGAFVALDPKTGEILTRAERSLSPKKVLHPVTSAIFPAASIFKIVTAVAVLEEADIPASTVTCYHGGGSQLSMENLVDNPKRDRLCASITTAFAHSTNSVFGKLAIKHLNSKKLYEWSQRLGFNQRIFWHGLRTRSILRRPQGNLALGRTAAGFTNSNLSPLHGAMIGMIFANNGTLPKALAPWFPQSKPENPNDSGMIRVVSPKTADALSAMMLEATTTGTARRYLSGVTNGPAAVKTGTLTSRDGSNLLNTWMVGYYPVKDPQFAFAAVVATQNRLRAGHLTRFALESFQTLSKQRKNR